MRSEHIKFFLSLYRTGSILQSSQELFTTHQNVSKIIRQLEDELGTALFIRSKKGVELTPAGKLFLPVAQQTVKEFKKVRTNIAALENSTNISGKLHILSSDLVTFTVLSSLIELFPMLYPSLTIHLENNDPLTILQKVALHPQMIGVVVILNNPAFYHFYFPYIQQLQLIPLIQDEYCCVVGPGSPLENYRSISLAQFAQHPIATTALNTDGESVLTKLISEYGSTVSFSTNNQFSYNNTLLSGRYVGLSSNLAHRKSVEENIKYSQIHPIPLEEDMSFSISLAINKRSRLNEAGKAFVDFMENSNIYM